MARLAIAKGFLAEYAKLDKDVQGAVDVAIARFARHAQPGLQLEKPPYSRDDRIRILPVDSRWHGVVLVPESGPTADTYCLVKVLPRDEANAYAASRRFSVNRALGVLEVRDEEAIQQLAHPFAAWRTFLHPNQREIAYRPSYAGPAQVTGGPGTGKTVTVLHRAAFLAERSGRVLITTLNGNLANALRAQLDLLIRDAQVRQKIEVLNVDRLAYRVVKQARGTPIIADERVLLDRWAKAAADAGLSFTPAFGKNEWEQVLLAQDLRTEQAYLTCLRTGRGRPLTKAQRGQVWQAAQRVTAELADAREATHLQLAGEATHLLRQAEKPPYRHILVDEAQDLHPSQWRLLRAAVAPGPDDLFIAADPHQRVYDNRVSLASLRISVRGRSRRLSLNYRTTQEILAWAVPLLGTEPVIGLDGEVDSLLGYRSPMRGPRPQRRLAAARAEEFNFLTERVRSWLSADIEPHAIGVAARSASLVREARQALEADGIATVSLSGRGNPKAVRAGTMHAMKGLEFQAVAVIGVEQGLVPAPGAVTPEREDAAVHAQDLQRERCVLFVACTRARDHLYVSGTGEPSVFLPPPEAAPPPPPPPILPDADIPAFDLGRFFRLLLSRRRLDPGMDAESFLAWATAPGRRLRLAELDVSSRQVLSGGGDQALDLVDRCLDLLDRLTERDPDLSAVRLPARFADAARQETGARSRARLAARRTEPAPPCPRIALVPNNPNAPNDPNGPGVQVILPPIVAAPDGVATWRVTADGVPVTIRSRAGTPQLAHPLTRPVRAVHVSRAGRDHVTELDVVSPSDPILFFSSDGRRLPARLPLPPDRLWILRPADRELIVAGELRTITEVPSGWGGWHLELASVEEVSSLLLPGGPAHAVQRYPRPRLLLAEPLPGVTTPHGAPVYPEPPQLWLPDAGRWHVGIRPAAGGPSLVSREIHQPGPADIWDGVPRPILGAFDITARGSLGRSMRRTIFVAEDAALDLPPSDLAPSDLAPSDLARSARARVAELRTGTAAAPVIVMPPRPRSHSDVVPPRPLASGAEVSSGQLTIRDRAAVDGLAAALYLARAPWRAPVIVPVPSDGVVKLPPEVREAGPLRVLLGVEDPWTVTNWPDWPGRDSFDCAAPGIPASADLEEDALSRFLGGQRDLPVRPRRADRLWRLLYLAGDLIAAGAPADLRERCSAVLGHQPGLALTGLLDSGLDSAACLVGLISTGLATARPVMMDNMRAAERLWHTVPAAAAVLCTRLLAGPAYPDEDPAAVVVEAALAQCGPALDALLRGDDDPCVQVFTADPFKQADLFEGADLLEAKWPAAVVIPQPLLDADTRAVAARQLFDAWSTPELTSAAQDATSVVRSAERLVAATPYRRAAAQIAARRLALPAMSASLALVARIAARGDEACRSFERTWRGCWTDLARRAPDLTGIDLVLAEAHIAAAERAWFAK